MLLKSIDYSPWRVNPAPISRPRRFAGPEIPFASFVPERRGAHMAVLIDKNRGSENRAILTLTKIAADFVNCMRES
jgi:hypothetical protein